MIQTGTQVMEMRNIGSFDTPLRVMDELPAEIQVPKMIQICDNNGMFMKEHNADYLSDEASSILVWESMLLTLLLNLVSLRLRHWFPALRRMALRAIDEFLDLSYNSRKWEKWMIHGTKASDRDRAYCWTLYFLDS